MQLFMPVRVRWSAGVPVCVCVRVCVRVCVCACVHSYHAVHTRRCYWLRGQPEVAGKNSAESIYLYMYVHACMKADGGECIWAHRYTMAGKSRSAHASASVSTKAEANSNSSCSQVLVPTSTTCLP